MHGEDFDHEHEHALTDEDRAGIAAAILAQDTLELRTVGIDIGSSTSHLLFARVLLRREAEDLSSRFVVVDRAVEWRSPIMLTPFRPDGTIDDHELARFVRRCYAEAGRTRHDVDSGAVILTGEAVKRRNARAIDEIFAGESGKFVCATAGHRLESILAAHGSGATALSRRRSECGLHVDIGGGTTKFALVDRGEIVGVAAVAVGGRLLARDQDGRWTRIDESAQLVAKELNLVLSPAGAADPAVRREIAGRLAEVVVDRILGAPPDDLGRLLALTEPLDRGVEPRYLTFSGGVAEYLFGHETADYGDIAGMLAAALVAQLGARVSIPSVDAGQRIRATVIGASQFTVQVSGKTSYLSGPDLLPLRNVPVVPLGRPLPEHVDPDALAAALLRAARDRDRDPHETIALAVGWTGLPSHTRLSATALAIAKVVDDRREAAGRPVVLVTDGDVAQSLGRILRDELGLARGIVSIDGVTLADLDYIDVGEPLDPPGVIPVVIKSLLFSDAEGARS